MPKGARRQTGLNVNRRLDALDQAADRGAEVAASPGAGLLDNSGKIRPRPDRVAQGMLLQRNPEGHRSAVRTEDGLTLLPERGATARPFGKPLVGDPHEFAPTRKGFAVVGQD